ncbi:hypothetical protein [Paenibacillus contaminans]|uniref:hypothetical protein n=1 Tax=Paenibacillus contaminans TaxID=450362 RepID=UPI001314B12D|nr:hypothetical protein [Paenibacillus contaminans]
MKNIICDKSAAAVQKRLSHGYEHAYMLEYEGTKMEAEGLLERRSNTRSNAVSFGGWRG